MLTNAIANLVEKHVFSVSSFRCVVFQNSLWNCTSKQIH